MNPYRVLYSPSVRADLRAHVQHLCAQHVSAATIQRWYMPLLDAIDHLYEMPRSNPVDEIATKQFGYQVRKLTYKHYTVHYRVDDAKRLVEVLAFIHGSQRHETKS